MKDAVVHIYQDNSIDGIIYVEMTGLSPEIQCEITLFKNRNALKPRKGCAGIFYNQGEGIYKAAIILRAADGSLATLLSNELTIPPSAGEKIEQKKSR